MDDTRRTIEGATHTSEGIIPHKVTSWGFLPVMVTVNLDSIRDTLAYPTPMRNSAGKLLYATPGGGFRV